MRDKIKNVEGIVFGIQNYSIHDGPGIRTTVFFKGCVLKCEWCHNPEGISYHRQLSFMEKNCELCGDCVRVCTQNVHRIENGKHYIDRDKCKLCGDCVRNCTQKALSITGNIMKDTQIVELLKRDEKYFNSSGGGVTVSGGEPMCQFEFLKSLLKLCKKNNINTVLETSGAADTNEYIEIAKYTDLFLYDYKATNNKKHMKFIGVRNDIILINYKKLLEEGAKMILRCPIIPGFNDNDEHFKAIADLSREKGNILGFELMPYHMFGIGKSEQHGLKKGQGFEVPKDKRVEEWRERIIFFGGKEYIY